MPPPEDPDGAPEYRVYRSRKALLPKRGGGERDELARLRGTAQRPAGDGGEPGGGRRRILPQMPERGRAHRRRGFSKGRVVKWLLLGIFGWIALSVLVFLVSAQIQQGKVSDANH